MTPKEEAAFKLMLSALESAQGNINPERGFVDEAEREISLALSAGRAELSQSTSGAAAPEAGRRLSRDQVLDAGRNMSPPPPSRAPSEPHQIKGGVDWNSWIDGLAEVLAPLAQESNDRGSKAEGLGQLLPVLRRALGVPAPAPSDGQIKLLAVRHGATTFRRSQLQSGCMMDDAELVAFARSLLAGSWGTAPAPAMIARDARDADALAIGRRITADREANDRLQTERARKRAPGVK